MLDFRPPNPLRAESKKFLKLNYDRRTDISIMPIASHTTWILRSAKNTSSHCFSSARKQAMSNDDQPNMWLWSFFSENRAVEVEFAIFRFQISEWDSSVHWSNCGQNNTRTGIVTLMLLFWKIMCVTTHRIMTKPHKRTSQGCWGLQSPELDRASMI